MRKTLLRAFVRSLVFQISALAIFSGLLGWQLQHRLTELFLRNATQDLKNAIALYADRIPREGREQWCQAAVRGVDLRVTLAVPETGQILCDSAYGDSPARPVFTTHTEIPDAVRSADHTGHSRRWSEGLGFVTGIFEAKYFPEQHVVLRVGSPLTALQQELAMIRWVTWTGTLALAAVLCAVLYVGNRRWLFSNTLMLVDQAEAEMQRHLVANVSHEFRTPLTAIRGFATMLEQDLRDQRTPQLAHTEVILKETGRLMHLVEDLLDVAVLESGHVPLVRESLAVESLTRDALTVLKATYGPRVDSVRTEFEVSEVWGDAQRLHQLVLNLVGNAIKYTPAQTEIVIRWRPAGAAVLLVVEDTGPGIPQHIQSRLFQRFTRGVSNGAARGTGLGLVIARGIAQAHGGSLEWQNLPTGGARFTALISARS